MKFSAPEGNIEISKMLELEVTYPKENIELEMSKKELKKYYAENQF